jgi:hypothetical protein
MRVGIPKGEATKMTSKDKSNQPEEAFFLT